MAYYKTKLERNGEKASHCFKPFVTGQMFAYPGSSIGSIQTVLLALPVSWGYPTQL